MIFNSTYQIRSRRTGQNRAVVQINIAQQSTTQIKRTTIKNYPILQHKLYEHTKYIN